MVRRFVDLIHVGLDDAAVHAGQSMRPSAFQWRGQRYVVHEVLGHWRERRDWWAVGDGVETLPQQREQQGLVSQLAEEYEVWRVEARRTHGRSIGVYDLCHDSRTPASLSTWRLLRLVD